MVFLSCQGHTGAVYCVGFAPSGRLLASGSFDKSVRLWDLTQQKEARTFFACVRVRSMMLMGASLGAQIACLAEHQLNISDLAWSSDSAELLSGGFDRIAKLWDTNKLESTRHRP